MNSTKHKTVTLSRRKSALRIKIKPLPEHADTKPGHKVAAVISDSSAAGLYNQIYSQP